MAESCLEWNLQQVSRNQIHLLRFTTSKVNRTNLEWFCERDIANMLSQLFRVHCRFIFISIEMYTNYSRTHSKLRISL